MRPAVRRVLIGLAVVVGALVALAVVLNATGRVKTYRIPSPAMEPGIHVGDRILVGRFGFPFGSKPERGDVVVFHPPAGADTHNCGARHLDNQSCALPTPGESPNTFIKRVVALPGETVAIRNNRAYVNGRLLDEADVHTSPCDELCNLPQPITVPPDHYFMLGDNRGASDDSRDWGPVPRKWLIGKRLLTYWPL
jgi:signal peptidase I